jgi:poly-gamma-glutamate capsule biosynthesis protein CapA/YwtB (metallophosphatase superfamily)
MPFSIAVTGQILTHGPLDLVHAGTERVRALLQADATLANLEATVTVGGSWPTKTKTLHLAAPEALASVRALGFSALAHANNHAFDLGPPGIAATHRAAADAGLRLTGSGSTLQEALTPALHTATSAPAIALFAVDLGPQPDIVYASTERAGIAPLRVKRCIRLPPAEFGVLQGIVKSLGDDARMAARQRVGYSAAAETSGFDAFGTDILPGEHIAPHWHTDTADTARLKAAMAEATAAGAFVAVALHCHHWDADWRVTPEWLIDVARDLIDAGAGLVIGTGAPILQGMRFYKGRPILGGLGNFVFHTNRAATYDTAGTDVWRSVAARLSFSHAGDCLGIEVLPIAVGRPENAGAQPFAPVPLSEDDGAEMLARFTARLTATERRLVRPVR